MKNIKSIIPFLLKKCRQAVPAPFFATVFLLFPGCSSDLEKRTSQSKMQLFTVCMADFATRQFRTQKEQEEHQSFCLLFLIDDTAAASYQARSQGRIP